MKLLKQPQKKLIVTSVTVLLVMTCSLSGFGAVVNVSVGNDFFSPNTSAVHVGDQVVWTWSSGADAHNVVSISASRAWLFPSPGGAAGTTSNQNDSNLRNNPFTFTNTFDSAGSFPYECTEHASVGMLGTINVTANVAPPSVSITSPTSGAVFIAPANVAIQATAMDSNGTVTNVQFLIGATVLINQATSPLYGVTNKLAVGNYTLSVIASANNGTMTTNAVTISVVTPLPLVISAPKLSSASFQFSYTANMGLSYIVQRSTNLAASNWLTLITNKALANPAVFADSQATNTAAFYRVGLLPNP